MPKKSRKKKKGKKIKKRKPTKKKQKKVFRKTNKKRSLKPKKRNNRAKIIIQGATCPFNMYTLLCCESKKDNKRAVKLFRLCKISGAIIDFVFHARNPKMTPRI